MNTSQHVAETRMCLACSHFNSPSMPAFCLLLAQWCLILPSKPHYLQSMVNDQIPIFYVNCSPQ